MAQELIYLDFYNGKYCKVPDSLVPASKKNYSLRNWFIVRPSDNKILAYEPSVPISSSYKFTDTDKDYANNIQIKAGSILLENMLLDSNESSRDWVTFQDLLDENVTFKPYWHENYYLFKVTDGITERIYSNEAFASTFTIPDLANIPTKEGYVFDKYLIDSEEVNENTVFTLADIKKTINVIFVQTFTVRYFRYGSMQEEKTIKDGDIFVPQESQWPNYNEILDGYFEHEDFSGDPLPIPIVVTRDLNIYPKYSDAFACYLYTIEWSQIYGEAVRLGGMWDPDLTKLKHPNEPEKWDLDKVVTDQTASTEVEFPYGPVLNYTNFFVIWKRKPNIEITLSDGQGNTHTLQGTYESNTDSYIFQNLPASIIVNDLVWNLKGYRYNMSLYKPTKDVSDQIILSVPSGALSTQGILEFAKPATWKIIPTLERNILADLAINYYLPYNTTDYVYKEAIANIPYYSSDEYIDVNKDLPLAQRVFQSATEDLVVTNPNIDRTDVTSDSESLPNAYVRVKLSDYVKFRLTELNGGTVTPTELTVPRSVYNYRLTRDLFTVFEKDGYIFNDITYQDPSSQFPSNVGFGSYIYITQSVNATVNWAEAVTLKYYDAEDKTNVLGTYNIVKGNSIETQSQWDKRYDYTVNNTYMPASPASPTEGLFFSGWYYMVNGELLRFKKNTVVEESAFDNGVLELIPQFSEPFEVTVTFDPSTSYGGSGSIFTRTGLLGSTFTTPNPNAGGAEYWLNTIVPGSLVAHFTTDPNGIGAPIFYIDDDKSVFPAEDITVGPYWGWAVTPSPNQDYTITFILPQNSNIYASSLLFRAIDSPWPALTGKGGSTITLPALHTETIASDKDFDVVLEHVGYATYSSSIALEPYIQFRAGDTYTIQGNMSIAEVWKTNKFIQG